MATEKNVATHAEDVDTTSEGSNDEDFFHSVLNRKVVRKIDTWIMPLLFVTYSFNLMDKTILSSAVVFGLKDTTNLTGGEYSWVSSIFYFGYLFWEYPTTILIQRLPVGKYVAFNTFFWGTVVAVTAACTNFGGLITVRFLLGVAEATISPAFVYITSMWYTRVETPTRIGIWFAGNSLGGFITNLLAFGIGHIKHPLEPWQWMYIVLGSCTFLWGFVLLGMLPDSIASARFLTPEEKKCAEQRVILGGTGKAKHAWKPAQVLECLRDPKTFFFLAISILTQIPNGGTSSFGHIVLKGFGFTSLQTTLVTLPISLISLICDLGTGRAAGHWPNVTLFLICALVLCPIMGSAIIFSHGASRGVELFAYYLLAPGHAALPLMLSLISVNYKGSTKRMTMTAILLLAYCAGNISGPQFFKASEEPRYPTAFRANMICYALVILVAMGLRAYLIFENKRRDRAEGPGSYTSVSTGSEDDEEEELTDWNTKGFRYRM